MGTISRRFLLAHAAGLTLAAQAASRAVAQEAYPSRPIKLITPFPPGGPVDVMARLVAGELGPRVGQVVVDNRPGAGGTIGVKAAAAAAPDGYTLLIGSSTTIAAAPALYRNIGYDPVKSFTPVALIASVPLGLVVSPKLPVHSVAELIAYAKANPGKINFGAPTATLPHLTGEMFKAAAHVDIVHIPYKGAANAMTDMLTGQIDMAFEPISVLVGHVREGKMRALATAGRVRSSQLADLPTMIESGLADFVSVSWSGLLAPAGTPAAVITRLNAAMAEGLRSPSTQTALARLGAEPHGGSPEDFVAFIAEETPRWAAVIKAAGIRID